jgi:cytoskeletal protein CcmA (bactofilin family)
MNDTDFKNFNFNMLGLNSLFKGEIYLLGDSIITSQIIGNIKVNGIGKLILERGSKVEGKIEGNDIEIFGEVTGEIFASGTVTIRASAVVTGKINVKKLVIYPGAIVESECSSQED